MSPFALVLLLAAQGGGLTVRAELESSEATVGEPIRVRVEGRHAPGAVALLPDRLELPPALGERRAVRRHLRRSEGALEVDVYTVELVPFTAGLIEIPPLSLAVGSTVAASEPMLVKVASSLDEAAQVAAGSTRAENLDVLEQLAAGDAPPVGLTVFDPRPLYVLAAIVGLALAVALARRWSTRPKPSQEPPAPPSPPAHEVALAAFGALEGRGYLEKGAFNPYFTELSLALRRYLGDRYGFDALERTVDELLERLERTSTPGLDRRQLAALLFEAEQVKFAKFQPEPAEAQAALSLARSMVEQTRVDASAGGAA